MTLIPDTENVARLLNNEWIYGNRILLAAFQLRHGETYLSVNRPTISSYDTDVSAFVAAHPSYACSDNSYRRALLSVGDIRQIRISEGQIRALVDVEVEPRDAYTQSHAGIFTRLQGRNLKVGDTIKTSPLPQELSADSILLEVRQQLRQMAIMELCSLN